MRNLLAEDGAVDPRDFLARADVLAAAGKTVLISDYFEYYRLAAYLRRLHQPSPSPWCSAGQPCSRLFDEKYYDRARGRHPRVVRTPVRRGPEALRLSHAGSSHGQARYRCPIIDGAGGPRQALRLPVSIAARWFALEGYDPSVLPILSRDVLRRLKAAMPRGRPWSRRRSPKSSSVAGFSVAHAPNAPLDGLTGTLPLLV